jgi:hypothetical protein
VKYHGWRRQAKFLRMAKAEIAAKELPAAKISDRWPEPKPEPEKEGPDGPRPEP